MRSGDIKARVLGVVRNRGRQVMVTEPGQGLGNLLYLYLRAWRERARGIDSWVLESERLQPWKVVFPLLADYTLPAARLRFTDGRDFEAYQGFGTEFTADELRAFCRALLSGARLDVDPLDDDVVTVNVRRGDYFSDPRWRPLYSIDTTSYVAAALRVAATSGAFSRIQFVSDDIGWCRANLEPRLANQWEITAHDTPDPVRDLAALAGSRRLVLANSTFSYWGGFLSTTVHGENHAAIIAPWFHRRDTNGGAAWHLDPRWTVVRALDGWKGA